MSENTYSLNESEIKIDNSKNINSNVLHQNIKNVEHSLICLEPINLVCKDGNNIDFLQINLHKTELRDKHVNSIKLNFVSKKINDESVVSQESIDSNLIGMKYNLMCGHNLIFDDIFCQNEDLLTPKLILPIKYIEEHHSLCINILNIENILPTLGSLELHVSLELVEFEKAFDKSMPKLIIDQLIVKKNNTYNVFRTLFGMGVKLIGDGDFPKEKFNEIAQKINIEVLE